MLLVDVLGAKLRVLEVQENSYNRIVTGLKKLVLLTSIVNTTMGFIQVSPYYI